MWQEMTAKCPVCGDSYKIWIHYLSDQTACPKCLNKAKQNDKYKRNN